MSYTKKIKQILAAADEFTSSIEEVYISKELLGFLASDDVTIKSTSLVWLYDMEVRDFGIKSLIPIVHNQTLSVTGTIYNEETEEEDSFTKEVKLVNPKITLEKREDKDSLSLYPINIYERNNTWKITFIA